MVELLVIGFCTLKTPYTKPLAGSGCRVTASKINWSLSPAERELLKRDCRDSGVPVAVQDQQAIQRIVGLITTSGGDRR